MAGRRSGGHGFSRSDRVAEQIKRELAELIRFHLKDQRIAGKLSLVTVSGVEVTPDYAHAKVFYTSLAAPDDQHAIDEGLRRSAGFLRRELARRVRLHHIPELHFVFDPSVEEGARMTQLIDQAVESDRRHENE
jgi:ribosome-binding factor A